MKVVINVFFGYNVVNQHNLLKICSIRKTYYYFTWYSGCILPQEKNTEPQKDPTYVNEKSYLDALCLIFMIKDNLNNKELFLFFIDELSVTYSKY